MTLNSSEIPKLFARMVTGWSLLFDALRSRATITLYCDCCMQKLQHAQAEADQQITGLTATLQQQQQQIELLQEQLQSLGAPNPMQQGSGAQAQRQQGALRQQDPGAPRQQGSAALAAAQAQRLSAIDAVRLGRGGATGGGKRLQRR